MLTAIIYNSGTGSCERYARELSRQLHLPCEPLHKHHVRTDGKVIYVGWVMAGSVVGYAKARETLDIAAVVAVGMSPVTPAFVAKSRESNKIPAGVEFFLLQGGFHINKLNAPMHAAMVVMDKKIVRGLRAKQAKAPLNAQEQATLNMALTGDGEPASWDCSEVVAWAKKENGFFTKSRELAK